MFVGESPHGSFSKRSGRPAVINCKGVVRLDFPALDDVALDADPKFVRANFEIVANTCLGQDDTKFCRNFLANLCSK